MASPASDSAARSDRIVTVRPMRAHRKSRLGCVGCKRRKVKCDEARPACRACTLRRVDCVYEQGTSRTGASSKERTVAIRAPEPPTATSVTRIMREPTPCDAVSDRAEMKLLWFYTTATYRSLSYADAPQTAMNDMLQTVLVQHAFGAPFLMDSLLELASLHLQQLGQDVDPMRALVYRARSVAGYRQAIAAARPATFGALLANAILRPLLSTQCFRDPHHPPLYVVDWMALWQGVRAIVAVTSEAAIARAGMQPLFARPPYDADASVAAIPRRLLLMVSFIDADDADAAERPVYQESIRLLGWLYHYLPTGIDSVMALRTVAWGTFVPPRLLDLARAHRPRALIILAHYAAFLKLLQEIWWLAGVGDRCIKDICHVLDVRWHEYLQVPLAALLIDSPPELTRLMCAFRDER